MNNKREFLHGEFYWAEFSNGIWEPVEAWVANEETMFYRCGNRFKQYEEDFLQIGERIERKILPTKEEIKKALFDCAKISHELEGTLVERVFEKEAEAIMKLYGQL